MSEDLSSHMQARFTPEKITAMRARIGVPAKQHIPPFNSRPHLDTIRHFAKSYGDDNPLFTDPAHAVASPWGQILAPLHYLNTLGEKDPSLPPWTDDQKAAMTGGDPFRGINPLYSGTTWEWWRPVPLDKRIFLRRALIGVIEKDSTLAQKSVQLPDGTAYADETGTLIAWREILMIHNEKGAVAKANKKRVVEEARYSDHDLAEIDAAYANEFRRGPEPLYWEDVEEGPIPHRMVKGPLTVTDIIFWHVGGNETLFNLSPLRLGWQNRQKIPKLYVPNRTGAWEANQRIHWDTEFAQAMGNPYAYDYGAMREAWLAHFVYNWMGDHGWLWRFHSSLRKFNYLGDTTWITGAVTGKRELDGPRFAVDLSLVGTSQRGEETTLGTATVLLPSKSHGKVILPEPPAGARDLEALFQTKIQTQ